MFDKRMTSRTRWVPKLVPAVIASCLILSSAVAAQTTPTRPVVRRPVLPKPHKVPHTTRRESRAVVSCLRQAHLKPVVTSGVGFLWEGWVAKLGGFVYAQYYPTLKRATYEAKLLRREESGLAQRIVISEHVAPYPQSPVPKIVRCLHGRMITKQPRKQSGHFHF
jgi:hypothetical protein